MKRLRYCVICEKELESGGRVDRKYCGVGCTQAAYRLRHPEKRGSAAGCAVGALVVPLPIRPQSTALAGSAAKLEAENAALRREQAASKARVAQLERSGLEQQAQHAEIEEIATKLKDAERVMAELRRELTQQSDRADRVEELLAQEQRRTAELSSAVRSSQDETDEQAATINELRTAISKLQQALSEANQRIAQLEKRDQRWRDSADAQRRALDVTRRETEAAGQRAQSLAATASELTQHTPNHIEIVSVVPLRPPPPSPSAIPSPPRRRMLPWEVPSKADPAVIQPYWCRVGRSGIQWLEEQGASGLDEVPTQLYKKGNRRVSAEMREWIARNRTLVADISKELAGRIICTERGSRRTAEQKSELAKLALPDAISDLKRQKPDQTEVIDAHVRQHASKYTLLTSELIDAFANLRFDESKSSSSKRR